MRANERTEERIAQYSTRQFHSHSTHCGAVGGKIGKGKRYRAQGQQGRGKYVHCTLYSVNQINSAVLISMISPLLTSKNQNLCGKLKLLRRRINHDQTEQSRFRCLGVRSSRMHLLKIRSGKLASFFYHFHQLHLAIMREGGR